MTAASNRIEVLHGVNLGVLGRRPAEHYGTLTYDQLTRRIGDEAQARGLEPRFFQTDHEGAFVEQLHEAGTVADGLILNPGAWTHYSWAIRDALEIAAAKKRICAAHGLEGVFPFDTRRRCRRPSGPIGCGSTWATKRISDPAAR